MSIQETILNNPTGVQRVDLKKENFDGLVYVKGRRVLLEKAVLCPCKSKSTNQLSNCKNCGGSGWVFITKKDTRMVLTNMDVANKFMPWSEEARGMVSVTALCEDGVSYMDRITAVDGEGIYGEVLFLKKKGDVNFAYTTYRVREVEYIAKFNNNTSVLTRLTPDQYQIDDFAIKFLGSFPDGDYSFTIRYKHAPAFHVIELKRETMQSFELIAGKGDQLSSYPVSAYARRVHYALDKNNLIKDRLLDNTISE